MSAGLASSPPWPYGIVSQVLEEIAATLLLRRLLRTAGQAQEALLAHEWGVHLDWLRRERTLTGDRDSFWTVLQTVLVPQWSAKFRYNTQGTESRGREC